MGWAQFFCNMRGFGWAGLNCIKLTYLHFVKQEFNDEIIIISALIHELIVLCENKAITLIII